MFPALLILRVLSWLVPPGQRREWLVEWSAEVEHAWTARPSRARPLLTRVHLTLRAIDAVRDALFLRSRQAAPGGPPALREGLRSLRRRPAFASAAIVTLALGMGAATAVFSVVDGLMLRPLPFHAPEQLVSIFGDAFRLLDREALRTWADRKDVFADVRLHRGETMVLTGAGEARSYRAAAVEAGFLELLGVRPVLGRSLTGDDAVAGAPAVVLLGDAVWREAFGADRSVLGRTIRLNDEPHTVVGVLPPTLRRAPGGIVHLVVPLVDTEPTTRLYALARLQPGLPVDAAQARVDGAARMLQDERPRPRGWALALRPLARELDASQTRGLHTLSGAALLLLLIACANAAGLLLLRGIERRPELSLRVALGGSRASLMRLVLVESMVLAAVGGVLGTGVAWLGVRTMVALLHDSALARFSYTPIAMDLRVLGFSLGLTALTSVLFGALPALRAGAASVGRAARGATSSRQDVGLRTVMQVGQLALAVVLLWGAGLFGRSLLSIMAAPLGYDADRVLHLRLVSLERLHGDSTRTIAFAEELDAALRTLPGVDGVSRVFGTNVSFGDTLRSGGRVFAPEYLPFFEVDTAFFSVAGVPILEGRGFRSGDVEAGAVVVDRDLARALWPGGGAVGQNLQKGAEPPYTVVGVAGDMKAEGPRDPFGPYLLFHPAPPAALRSATVWVRAAGEPGSLVPAVRSLVRSLDPGQPIERIETGLEALGGTVVYTRFLVMVVTGFSVVALLLAAVGVYGLVSFTVAQRTRELGVRMALGARGERLVAEVMGRGLALGISGIALGVAAAAGLTRLVSSLLFGVAPTDPVAMTLAAGVLLACCAAAAVVPALRAAAVDPSRALRSE